MWCWWLRQIVLNLLINAINFSATDPNDPKGNVTVHIQANSVHQLVIFIKDDGVGMDAKTQCHIFELFRLADNVSTLNYDGTSLGLPIVHNFLANLQGQIDVESRPGEGSLFVARLLIVSLSGQLDIPVLKGWRVCVLCYIRTKKICFCPPCKTLVRWLTGWKTLMIKSKNFQTNHCALLRLYWVWLIARAH